MPAGLWDFTCRDTFCKTNLPKTSKSAGAAAEAAEKLKDDHYAKIDKLYSFQAVGYETSGVPGPGARAFIIELGRRMTKQSGDPCETSYLKQRIALSIQRGNALSFYGTLPHNRISASAPAPSLPLPRPMIPDFPHNYEVPTFAARDLGVDAPEALGCCPERDGGQDREG